MLTKKAAMGTLKAILRDRWSCTWPGLLVGMFSCFGLLLMFVFGLLGNHQLMLLTYLQKWSYQPPYFLIACILLLTLICSVPLLFTNLRRKHVVRFVKSVMPVMITLSALALGYFCCITLIFLDVATCIFVLASLLLLCNAADMIANALHAGNELSMVAKRAYMLCVFVSAGSIFCTYISPLL